MVLSHFARAGIRYVGGQEVIDTLKKVYPLVFLVTKYSARLTKVGYSLRRRHKVWKNDSRQIKGRRDTGVVTHNHRPCLVSCLFKKATLYIESQFSWYVPPPPQERRMAKRLIDSRRKEKKRALFRLWLHTSPFQRCFESWILRNHCSSSPNPPLMLGILLSG